MPLTPIARWDTVPYQRISAGETINVGVVAFSAAGMDKVTFLVTPAGGTYQGEASVSVDVSSMTLNSQTGVYEYWTPIACDDFSADGVFTVEATAVGDDAGERDKDTGGGGLGLDALLLNADPGSTLGRFEAWVATDGDDGTGTVDDDTKPYAGQDAATVALIAAMNGAGHGAEADGCIIYLEPGDYNSGGGFAARACNNEWLTVTRSTNGTKENTRLIQTGGPVVTPGANKLKITGITLAKLSAGQSPVDYSGANGPNSQLWIGDCQTVGYDRHVEGSDPVRWTNLPALGRYITDSNLSIIATVCDQVGIARGLNISTIGDDAFVRSPMIVNCSANDLDPGASGWHSDAWQWWGGAGDSNLIVYNYRATDLKYQGIFWRAYDINATPKDDAEGAAFVNVYLEGDLNTDNGGAGGFYRSINHFILWNCAFNVKHQALVDDSYGEDDFPIDWTGCSVIGCYFRLLYDWTVTDLDFSGWDETHYEVNSGVDVITPGTNITTGDPALSDYGRPEAGSALLDRITPLTVPIDLSNTIRDDPGEVGAYEKVAAPTMLLFSSGGTKVAFGRVP